MRSIVLENLGVTPESMYISQPAAAYCTGPPVVGKVAAMGTVIGCNHPTPGSPFLNTLL